MSQHRITRPIAMALGAVFVFALLGGAPAAAQGNPCAAKVPNPCAAKSSNPCAAKNRNPCNPCGGAKVDPAKFRQPEGAKLAGGDPASLRTEGERLWNDTSLGKSGAACSTCHYQSYGQMQPGFAKPYPHPVDMPAQRAGVSEVNAAEMVQFCMIVPMAAEPLPWSSPELAALTAYVESLQSGYKDVDGTPGNPCASKNPCNPCSKKNVCNPCAKKNACNPCGAKNPCNPCGSRH